MAQPIYFVKHVLSLYCALVIPSRVITYSLEAETRRMVHRQVRRQVRREIQRRC